MILSVRPARRLPVPSARAGQAIVPRYQHVPGPPKKSPAQLKLPLPEPTRAELRAYVRDRLEGYEVRQAAREAKRRAAAARRAGKSQAPQPLPQQMEIGDPKV